jgi:hypothetical protein
LAAQRSWPQQVEWAKAHSFNQTGVLLSERGSSVPKMVAERVIERHEVSPERVNAAVIVLEVVGQWSHLAAPGILLYSEESLIDDARFAKELEVAFESGLAEKTN